MIKCTFREPSGFSSRNESCCRWPWREDAQFHSQTAIKPKTTPSTDMCWYLTAKTIFLFVLPHVSFFVSLSYRAYFVNTECAYSSSGWTSPSWRCVRSRCDWLKWRTGAVERSNGVGVLLDFMPFRPTLLLTTPTFSIMMFTCNYVCRLIMQRAPGGRKGEQRGQL